MNFWGSLQVLKILVYFPYTDFRVLQKRRKGANYRRFIESKTMLDAL